METLTAKARERVLDILNRGRDMTLATVRPDGYPQATTISYANDGLVIYAGIGLGSQKAHNIQHNNKVSATIDLDYPDWHHILGLSLAGTAEFVRGDQQIAHASQALLHKFPQAAEFMTAEGTLPWQGMLLLRIVPSVVSLLDYSKGFGHTELYAVRGPA
ncbi:pyridoxamine 5'-phosphate oxidase family protein [Pseudoduganella sp. OTU4001]|uniref:pyridoxamine 5'-phosphate oxidase family protein n=1 Tax=Pseudoduganella sp. OTU4001 TaxID=3043854 RepID=UPI00313B0367